MRVLLLAEVNSSHTIKWVRGLVSSGVETAIFSFSPPDSDHFEGRVKVISIPGTTRAPAWNPQSISKMRYLGAVPKIRRVIKRLNPDILHAHYASSYGLVGALSGFKPFIVSVWGSDVFDFARKNVLTKFAMRFVFDRAALILSTSRIMALEAKKYTNKACVTLPFGVDARVFQPRAKWPADKNVVTVGTIKSLEDCYGIDLLLRAFALARGKVAYRKMNLLIVGGGSREASLRSQCFKLGISNETVFAGRVPYDSVPEWYARMDIFVALSRMESFGVSILEASASGLPVIATDVGGLPEVVRDGVSGFVVPRDGVEEAAAAITALAADDGLRRDMGRQGREFVEARYRWESSIDRQMQLYAELMRRGG